MSLVKIAKNASKRSLAQTAMLLFDKVAATSASQGIRKAYVTLVQLSCPILFYSVGYDITEIF